MRIEMLIYCYGAVCVSMILFNCICIAVFKKNDSKLNKKSRNLERRLISQMERIAEGEHVEPEHFSYLNRVLSRVGNLMAFDISLERLFKTDAGIVERYLYEIHSVLIYLAIRYQKKENMQSAYFAYFLAKYKICRYMQFSVVTDIIKEYLKKNSLYCRQNAMKALYSSGSEENVVKGIKILEQEHIFFHSKVLADGLLTFEGNHSNLIELLLKSLDKFRTETQVSILNYIRFKSGDYCEEMLGILTDKKRDRELHFAAIRYFGRYPYQPAYRILLEFAADTDEVHWNYAAFSASSLASYPGEETISVLKGALSSSNWYIRYNASQSLDALGLNYNDLTDVINGNDRYAREMIMYRFDCRQMKEQNEKKEVPAGV